MVKFNLLAHMRMKFFLKFSNLRCGADIPVCFTTDKNVCCTVNIAFAVLAVLLIWGCPEYDSYGDIPSNIYTVNIDGSDEVQLTDTDGDKWNPHFADDANKVVYWGHDENYRQSVFVMNTNGDNHRKIAPGRYSTISYDGQWIVYNYQNYDGKVIIDGVSYYEGSNLYKSNLDGSFITRLTEAIATDSIIERCWNAGFSYDDQYVVYYYERRENWEIVDRSVYMMKADGTEKKRLWPVSENQGIPRFTPNGSKVVILLGGWHQDGYQEEMRLGVFDLSTETMTKITSVFGTQSFAISPDGESIVYETKSGLYKEIFTINMDGSGKTKLTKNSEGDNAQPVFSPDGSKIAFVASVYGFYNSKRIVVMNNDGTDLTYLTDQEYRADENPSFSPDGKKIVFNNR